MEVSKKMKIYTNINHIVFTPTMSSDTRAIVEGSIWLFETTDDPKLLQESMKTIYAFKDYIRKNKGLRTQLSSVLVKFIQKHAIPVNELYLEDTSDEHEETNAEMTYQLQQYRKPSILNTACFHILLFYCMFSVLAVFISLRHHTMTTS